MESVNKNRYLLIDSVLLIVLVAVVYGRTLGHDFLRNWDDNWYVLYNDAVLGFSWEHLKMAFTSYYIGHYAPVQIVSYMLDYTLWELWPGGFHLTNIIIHAINGILVYRLFFRWHRDRLFALTGASIFLLHPVQVETVAWISQRKSLLAMFFFLLAWEWYCRYREADDGKGRMAYTLSVAAFILSLLAKSMTVVLPVVLLLYDHCFLDRPLRRALKDKIPFIFAAGIVAALVMYTQLPEVGGGGRATYHGGSPWATFLTMLPVFCRYLGMLVWPANLSAEYAPPIHQSLDAQVVGAACLLAAVAYAGVRIYRFDRRLGFWVVFFWIGLLPVSQIVPMIFLMYDHYLYLPLMGVAALAGAGGVWLRERTGGHGKSSLSALLLLPVLALSAVSFQRTEVWRDAVTLWSDAVAKEPASPSAWELYGEALYKLSGDTDGARKAYEQGLAINPANTEILYGLGELYTEGGELDKGLTLLNKLLELKPDYAMGWATLGDNYLKRGNYAEAERAYQQALTIQPEAMQVVSLLGNLAVIRGRLDEARGYFNQAEAQGWHDPAIAYQMARMEARAGHKEEALEWLGKALQRGYRDYNNLASAKELSVLKDDPRFKYLILHYFQLQKGQH